MRILVCLKQIRHIYAQTGIDPERHFFNIEDSVNRINPYDEAALEIALSLKKTCDETRIILFTIGKLKAEKELRRCLARGADEIYNIPRSEDPGSQVKSKMIKKVVSVLDIDVVLCGKESFDRRNGQVPARTAHGLSWPFISSIIRLEIDEKNKNAFAMRSCGKGMKEKISSPLPAFFSVDLLKTPLTIPSNAGINFAEEYRIKEIL